MKTITITLTDSEAILLDSQAKSGGAFMTANQSFSDELENYKNQRLQSARELAKRKITEPLTDDQLASQIQST